MYVNHSEFNFPLTDVRMPNMDGFQLAMLVRQMDNLLFACILMKYTIATKGDLNGRVCKKANLHDPINRHG